MYWQLGPRQGVMRRPGTSSRMTRDRRNPQGSDWREAKQIQMKKRMKNKGRMLNKARQKKKKRLNQNKLLRQKPEARIFHYGDDPDKLTKKVKLFSFQNVNSL